VFIITFVIFIIGSIIKNKYMNSSLMERQIIEGVWTIIPALILVQIAIPSLLLLYMLDETVESRLSIKVIGHQWYWSYEYSDFWSITDEVVNDFTSYMVPSDRIDQNIFRLLDVDNRTVIPYNVNIRLLVRSSDVLHSWTVPSLGVKSDAVPGRLNQLKFISQRPGLYYGQCSEICGANHRFIPIVIESVDSINFLDWIVSN